MHLETIIGFPFTLTLMHLIRLHDLTLIEIHQNFADANVTTLPTHLVDIFSG